MKRQRRRILQVFLLIGLHLLAACSTFEVGVEPTPTTPAATPPAPASGETPAAETVSAVQIYLVKLEDDGQSGPRVGCGDSVVPVERPIGPIPAANHEELARAALTELLLLDEPLMNELGLYNALFQSDLQVESVIISEGAATVNLTGNYLLGGTCDDPRFGAQIEQTILHFDFVETAEVFINSMTLRDIVMGGAGNEEPGVLRLAFVKDGFAWFWTEGGEAMAITQSGGVQEVRLSDDGRVVAFKRDGELWVVNSDGSNERRLVGAADFAAMDLEALGVVPNQFEWLPGSHVLAYNTNQVFEGPGFFIYDDFRLVNADTLEQSTPLPPGMGGEFTFSPDGALVALVTPGAIFIADALGTNRRQLFTYTPVTTYSEFQYYASPVWSAESNLLMVAIPPADPLAQPPGSTTLWRIPLDGSTPTLLASVVTTTYLAEPAIAPDLRHMAYLTPVAGQVPDRGELHVNTDWDETVVYATGITEFNGWSPDSRHFVYATDPFLPKQLGRLGAPSVPLLETDQSIIEVRWVDAGRFLALVASPRGWDITLGQIGGESQVIAAVAGVPPAYDFDN